MADRRASGRGALVPSKGGLSRVLVTKMVLGARSSPMPGSHAPSTLVSCPTLSVGQPHFPCRDFLSLLSAGVKGGAR